MKARVAWLLLLGLAACRGAPPQPIATATLQALPNVSAIPLESHQGATATEAPLELEVLDQAAGRSRYLMDVELRYNERRIQVLQTVDYLNQSEEILDELLFIVEGARLGGEFVVSRVAVDGVETRAATLEGDKLRLPLPEPLAPAARVQIELDYSLRLPPREGPLGRSSRQQNWADWYPFIPPYQAGEGWLAHRAAAAGEHLVYESADFLVRLQVTDREDVVLAAPSLPSEDGETYQLEKARRFAWSASPHYQLLEGEQEGIPVQVYVFAGHEEAGTASLAAAQQSLALYTELFGDYPYNSLSIVEADFPDGMESDGLFWLFNGYFEGYTGNPQNYLTTLTAHEVAHNWWFGQVGNDAALEPWLDEALCTYSEWLFYEHYYPELLTWWWRFRILDYAPTGFVDSSIYNHEGFAPYVQAVYFRGTLFLNEVREIIGHEALLEILADYAHAGQGQLMSGQELLGRLLGAGGSELHVLLESYFAGTYD